MHEILHDHHTSFFLDERWIFILLYADDIDLIASANRELQEVTNQPENQH